EGEFFLPPVSCPLLRPMQPSHGAERSFWTAAGFAVEACRCAAEWAVPFFMPGLGGA
ncbi:hypothetical protein HMPREF9946_03443, partial [Acetobacteraceae bacterium AT-5844]